MFSSLVGAKLVVAATAGCLSLGGVAAAEVSGSLPGPFQPTVRAGVSMEDDQGGTPTAQPSGSPEPSESADPSQAPDPTDSADPSSSADPSKTAGPSTAPSTHEPVGPDATGPAMFGLCHAFGGSKAVSKAGNPSVANCNLQRAAAAAGKTVQEYCADILGAPAPASSTGPTASAEPGPAKTHGRPEPHPSKPHPSKHAH